MPSQISYTNIPVVDGVNYVITASDGILYYYVTGTVALTSNWSISIGAGASASMRCHFHWNANVTLGGNHIFIFGQQIPDVLATKDFDAMAFYDGSSWVVRTFPDFEESGIVTTDDIADDAVTNDKLNNMTRGTVKVGGVANAPTDLVASVAGQILVGNGTDVASVAVSGDATLSGAGALTIAANAVDNTKIADMVRGTVKVGGVANAPTDLDAKTAGNILVGNGTDIVSVPMSGNATISGAGVVTVTGVGPWEDGAGTGSAQTENAVTGCSATGDYAIAAGQNSTASGDWSLAIGNTNVASGHSSAAIGSGNTASGLGSIALGSTNTASATQSAAIGSGNNVSGNHAIGIGINNTVSGTDAAGLGNNLSVTGNQAFACGQDNESSGVASFTSGTENKSSGIASSTRGQGAVAHIDHSSAMAATHFNIFGDAQKIETILKVATTTNVTDNMQLSDGTDGITIPTDCTAKIKIEVVAVQTGGVAGTIGDSFSQEIKLTANNIAGVSAVVPTAAVTLANYSVVAGNVLYELPFNTAAFAGTVVASVAANKLQIAVTGENNKDIQWVAYVSMVWTGYRNFSI